MSTQKVWDLFFVPGHCIELRVIGLQGNNRLWTGYAAGVVTGYFNDYTSFAANVANLDKLNYTRMQVTINPIKPEVLARAANHMVGATKDNSTTENDIAYRRWLYLDIDPKRAKGISSSQEELQAAADTARRIIATLDGEGWGKGVLATSGNGMNVLYQIDLQNAALDKELVKNTIAYIAERFSSDTVSIDPQTYHANAMVRCYGSWNRKGDSTADRPHRRSQIIDIPGQYKLVNDLLIKPQPKEKNQRSFNGDTPSLAQVEEWLSVLPSHFGDNSYQTWTSILMAVHSAYPGEDGVALCEKYLPGKPNEIKNKFAGFNGNGTGIGTLIHMAKEYGWSAPVKERHSASEHNADESSTFDLNFGGTSKTETVEARNYSASKDMLYRIIPSKRKNDDDQWLPIADFAAAITTVIAVEDGSKVYQITGNAKRGGAFTCEIDATDYEESRKLKGALGSAAGALDPIHAGMGDHLGPAIKSLSKEVTSRKRFLRTGWNDGTFLIPGHTPEGIEISLPAKLPYQVAPGDTAKGIEALRHLINFMGEDGAIILAHVLTAPMARLAGWTNERYGLFIKGRTGTHKTSVTQCLMSIYGQGYMNRENLIQWGKKFGSTTNALMGYCRYASDMTLLIDNYKPYAAEDARELITLIHAVMEGSDKDRMNRDSTLQQAQPFRVWPIFTGEDLPDSDAAALARLLTVQSKKNDNTSELTKAQQLAAHLPAIGHSWITWLETAETIVKDEASRLGGLRDEIAVKLMADAPNMKNPYRVATNLATNLILWRVVAHHPELGQLAQEILPSHMERLTALSQTIAEQTSEAAESMQLLNRLSELIATGKVSVIDKDKTPNQNETIVGWRASDNSGDNGAGVYLLLDAAREAVKRLSGYDLSGFSTRTLTDQLDEIGAIGHLRDPKRKTKQIRTAIGRPNTIHIKAKFLFGEDEFLDL